MLLAKTVSVGNTLINTISRKYGYPPLLRSFPGAPQFYHQSPFNMKHYSQRTSSESQRYPSDVPPWQGYDLHQGGYAGSQMFPPSQFTRQGPSSPGARRVPPGLPGNHPVIRPMSSSSTPPPQMSRFGEVRRYLGVTIGIVTVWQEYCY
jgi:hypothetical protein